VPDEVIICDDVSVDATVAIIRKFIEENHLETTWHLYENAENKGYPGNFYYAMSLCTKDVVFLSDQDDIWCEQKLEQMCKVLEKHSEARAVCCKFGLIDGVGQSIQTLMAPTRSNATGELREIAIKDVFYKYEWPGMVVAYRNSWYKEWEVSYTGSRIPHDFLVCARAAEEKGFLQMDEELAYHRRHDNNTGGEEHRMNKLLDKGRKLKEIKVYLEILDCFKKEQVLKTSEGTEVLMRKLNSMRGRQEALMSGKIGKVLGNAWKHREEVRIATVVCDVVIVKR